MILFSEIFDRAVNLFDDPDIRRDYVLDPAGFQQEMRPFLINGSINGQALRRSPID